MTSAITDASIEANSTPHIADPYGHVYYTRSGTTSYVLSASGFDFYFGSSLESIPSGEPPFQKAIYQNYPPGSDISGGNYVYTGTDVLAFGGNLAIYKADGTPFSAISILLDPSYRFDVNDEIDVTGYDSNGASHAEQFHLNSQSQLQSIPINLSGLTVLNIYSSNWLLFDGFTYEDGTQVPEITVLGNGVTILDGDTTPSTTDGSDFGTTTLGGAGVTHTFTVRNDGNATLTTSAPSLPTGFTLVEGLSSSIAAGGSDTFTVRLHTTSA